MSGPTTGYYVRMYHYLLCQTGDPTAGPGSLEAGPTGAVMTGPGAVRTGPSMSFLYYVCTSECGVFTHFHVT